ncbi:response regulator [Chitinimonas lacunae]|uniref:Response regulator n=1 Tax=Chitinimonas lacunae TaxID=1963018 RepID=A0ABV8MKY1_9NEIS
MSNMQAVDILLVEDNPTDAELTLTALAEQRVANRVIWVTDGESALDYLFCRGAYRERDPTPPRLVLLDLKLPKIDGIEVLQALRADPMLSRLPVTMLTSSAEESDLARSYDLGVNSYVVKPVDFDQFSTEVSRLGFYWLLINHSPPYPQGRPE